MLQKIEQVYKALEHAILIGQLRPRERLVEADLARKLGVSRTLLREVYRWLEGTGLVRLNAHRGAVVRDFTRQEIEDVYLVRVLLERTAAQLIVQNITADDLQELRAFNRKFTEACLRRDFAEMINTNLVFHRRLAAVARNATLERFLEILRVQTHQMRYVAWMDERNVEVSLSDHAEMIEALERRDGSGFESAVVRHVEMGKRHYIQFFCQESQEALT